MESKSNNWISTGKASFLTSLYTQYSAFSAYSTSLYTQYSAFSACSTTLYTQYSAFSAYSTSLYTQYSAIFACSTSFFFVSTNVPLYLNITPRYKYVSTISRTCPYNIKANWRRNLFFTENDLTLIVLTLTCNLQISQNDSNISQAFSNPSLLSDKNAVCLYII
jgi:hypothetical protein